MSNLKINKNNTQVQNFIFGFKKLLKDDVRTVHFTNFIKEEKDGGYELHPKIAHLP